MRGTKQTDRLVLFCLILSLLTFLLLHHLRDEGLATQRRPQQIHVQDLPHVGQAGAE